MTPEIKGERLFVNLSAAQTRRRLKGFGHGVKKIQSAGKNRAVVIHTASGQHLRELLALFKDVGAAPREEELGGPLENLKNLGPTATAWLRAAGIRSRADLERLGPVAVFRIVRRHEPTASLNLLWALAGAVQDRDWRDLSAEEKGRLKRVLAED